MCNRYSFHHIFSVSQEEMVNVHADLEDHFAMSKTVPGTRSSHHLVPISCNKIAHKLTNEDSKFLQFDFTKLTKSVFCIVTEVNVHKGDLKIEFLQRHKPRKTLSWPSAADKCFVPASNILCVITAPTTTTGQMY